MATILLSAAGAAIGGSLGGTVLGLSMAAVGRFAGAVVGRSIDQRLMGQGSEAVEVGRISRLRLSGAGEGDAIARATGRIRVGGHVIWASQFLQTTTVTGGGGGGKGAPSQPARVSYSYSVSLAIAMCEGEISRVGRIWADGIEIAPDSLTMRVYPGSADQQPDPRIEAIEGAGSVPAYRGTAYVVIEDLDLGTYGNRVPQFTFEVVRPVPRHLAGAEHDPVHALRGVAMLPGSGDYALATSPVYMRGPGGSSVAANINSASAKADFLTSLEALQGELPACGAVSLVVSWFGDDLRCGSCTVQPKPEQAVADSLNMPWQVSGRTRFTAPLVAQDTQGNALYGGTPSDQSVVEALLRLKAEGMEVLYYPFILMDQTEGNALPDPYSDASSQPPLPWRGRITASKAPGQPQSPDGTAGMDAEIAAFFGTASAGDFIVQALAPAGVDPANAGNPLIYSGPVTQSPVQYTGPGEWSYRRFILHQAALCKAAGGVESFSIGSEMRGLTWLRGAGNSFPAVAQLIALAGEVRALLGPEVKITYAADWSEYFGYQPQDGSGDRFFHLDPLWADANIDFIGIDNYMPLSDWRDGEEHADAAWGSPYDTGYLMANIAGGEGYDWYYRSEQARAAQIRTPITDEAHGEPWVWRYKDIANWWRSGHFERVGGVRSETATPWVPQSKPIRFTEYGCPAVDKGPNQPNAFVDAKSSESKLPYFSNGQRDEAAQMAYLRAMAGYWTDPAHNPVSELYDAPMLDWAHSCAWAWDARPFPAFPGNRALWSDAGNYGRGHWLTGRMSAWRLASVLEETCARAGLPDCRTDGLDQMVRGYLVEQVAEPRGVLQPLMLRYGVDAVERDGLLQFRARHGRADHVIDAARVVRNPEMDGTIDETRASAIDQPGRVRLRFVEAEADYEVVAEEAVVPGGAFEPSVSTSEIPLVMTRAEGRQVAERWLSEARAARDAVQVTLPRSQLEVGAGDVVALPDTAAPGLYRVDRVEHLAHAQKLDAVRIEPESYRPVAFEDSPGTLKPIQPPARLAPIFLDLPLMTGEEVPHAPHVAVSGNAWSGAAAVYGADEDAGYLLDQVLEARTPLGVLETPLDPHGSGVVDRGTGVQVRMLHGTLEAVGEASLLNGANLCAIGDGSPGGWELIQFRDAELIAPGTYALSHLLRGQLGTEADQVWPEGSFLVRLDGSPQQLGLRLSQLGLERYYRVGPADKPYDDPSYAVNVLRFDGAGLRPLSPVHMRAVPEEGGGLRFTWLRRTRIGGDSWDGLDVPLGEERELYMLRVRQGETVLREETLLSPEWTYTAAARAADGVPGLYTVEVAQVSAQVGPGSWAQITLSA